MEIAANMSSAMSCTTPIDTGSLESLDATVAEHIRHAPVDGQVVILDLRVARYFLLDEVATSMWQGVVGHRNRASLVAQIVGEFAGDNQQVERDLQQFLQSCMARNWVVRRAEIVATSPELPHGARSGRGFLWLRAWWSLLTTWTLLKLFGFQRLYTKAVVEAATERRPEPSAPKDLLQRAEAAFLFAENFFILPQAPRDCLPRSMALFIFLRRLGLAAQHRIGVERYPMTMHAWVECCDGVVLNDPGAERSTVLATLGT